MATRMKRLAVGVLALASLGGLGAQSAVAQTATTTSTSTTAPAQPPVTATFASPVSAPSGTPIWIRSITPCPAPKPGTTSWVEAQVLRAIDLSAGDKVWGHVRDNGDWDITLPAPAGPGGGATGRYLIQVQCGTTGQPPVDDPDAAQTITRKYVSRTLVVTSGAATGADWIDGPVGGVATTTTTTAPPATTTTTVASGGGSLPPGFTPSAAGSTSPGGGVPTKSSFTSASQVQAEIAKKAATAEVRSASTPDYVALNASPASAARDEQSSSGGIPAWSFACAAALAVGAVVAWGQRRSAPVEIRSASVESDQ